MLLFGRLLRAVGLGGVTTSRIEDWVTAAGMIDVGSRADFRSTAEAILVTRREDLEWFRAAFDLFFVARDPTAKDTRNITALPARSNASNRPARAACPLCRWCAFWWA
jgi:uncharacterized protein with von Willebrand factor type A (vWA) domain